MVLGRGECGLADADNEYATIDDPLWLEDLLVGVERFVGDSVSASVVGQ